jgi:hypothetical protein
MPRQNFSKIETLPENDLKKIQSLAKNGYSFKYIFSWLQETGFKIAEKTVQNWHKKYLESIKDDSETASKALSAINKQERDTTANPLIDNPEDLERIRESWKVNTPEFYCENVNNELGDNSLELTTKVMSYDLFISASVVTKNRLNLYQKGESKFPIEQIKALKILYDIYSHVWALHINIHPETALRCIDNLNKNIKLFEDHGVIPTDDDDYD